MHACARVVRQVRANNQPVTQRACANQEKSIKRAPNSSLIACLDKFHHRHHLHQQFASSSSQTHANTHEVTSCLCRVQARKTSTRVSGRTNEQRTLIKWTLFFRHCPNYTYESSSSSSSSEEESNRPRQAYIGACI